MEQVKSGFVIAAKLLSAFCIAATFIAGCELVEEAGILRQITTGWLLIIASIIVMTTTVRFWAAGFVAFIAYVSLRLLGGALFTSFSLHVSALLLLSLAASFFAMSLLGLRFASGKSPITQIDRISLLVAAACVLLSFRLMDTYKSVAMLNVGNVVLLLSWWLARTSRHSSHSKYGASAR